MLLKDMECRKCGRTFDVHDMGTIKLIGELDGNAIESDKIICPYCNSEDCVERDWNNYWEA